MSKDHGRKDGELDDAIEELDEQEAMLRETPGRQFSLGGTAGR